MNELIKSYEFEDIKLNSNVIFYILNGGPPMAVRDVINCFKKDFEIDKKINFTEIYQNNYLNPTLTLFQNIDFHCNSSMNSKDAFLQANDFKDLYCEYGNSLSSELPFNLRQEVGVLLYMFNNEINIFEKIPLLQLINMENQVRRILFRKYLQVNNVVYLAPPNINLLNKFKDFFGFYAILKEDNTVKGFIDADEAIDYVKELSKK